MDFRPTAKLAGVGFVLALLSVAPVQAFEHKAFDADGFKAAQASGKPIIVDVWASWCPTCKAQEAVLGKLDKNPAYANVTVYRLDYDTQAAAWKGLGVRTQSTMIAFSGTAETGRLVGQTDAKPIEDLVATTLKK